MKLTLRNVRRAGEPIEVDWPMGGSDDLPFVGASAAGLYGEIHGVTIGLFVRGDGLFIWLDGEVFEVGDDLAVDHTVSGTLTKLVVRVGRKSHVIEYTRETPVSTLPRMTRTRTLVSGCATC